MGAQAARLSVLRSAYAAASLSLRSGDFKQRRVLGLARGGGVQLGSREGQIHSSPRLNFPPGIGSCINSIFSEARGPTR